MVYEGKEGGAQLLLRKGSCCSIPPGEEADLWGLSPEIGAGNGDRPTLFPLSRKGDDVGRRRGLGLSELRLGRKMEGLGRVRGTTSVMDPTLGWFLPDWVCEKQQDREPLSLIAPCGITFVSKLMPTFASVGP